MTRLFAAILVLVIPGMFILTYHIRLLRGKGNKAYYMADHIYAGRVYVGIPGGLMLLIWAIATIPESSSIATIIVWIGLGFGVLGLIFAFIQPSFLKPTWLQWLEREYGDIMPILRGEVRKTGDRAWNQQIQTQADLEQWVAQVRRKHNL